MVNAEVREGVHYDKKKGLILTEDQVKLMQTQDHRYVSTRRVIEANKIKSLQANLHKLDTTAQNRLTFFVDDVKDLRSFSLTKKLDTPRELIGRAYNRVRNRDIGVIGIGGERVDAEVVKRIVGLRRKAYRELRERRGREAKLGVLERKIEVKRVLQVRVVFLLFEVLWIKEF